MLRNSFLPDSKKEKRQLEVLAVGFAVIALFFGLLTHRQTGATVFTALALLSLTGRVFFQQIGRDVYLYFALITTGIGYIISKIVMVFLYILGIAFVGTLLKLIKMDLLEKNWVQCKGKSSMFKTAPETTKESFERLS